MLSREEEEDLFGMDGDEAENVPSDFVYEAAPYTIDGFSFLTEFISFEQEKGFCEWLADAGYFARSSESQDTSLNSPDQVMFFGYGKGFPAILKTFCEELSTRLEAQGLKEAAVHFDQAIINLYYPGNGLQDHVDLTHRFGNLVIVLSLGSALAMRYTKVQKDHIGEARSFELWLPRRSLLVLRDEARYEWTHGIVPRAVDVVKTPCGLITFTRSLRISLTLRTLLPGADVLTAS